MSMLHDTRCTDAGDPGTVLAGLSSWGDVTVHVVGVDGAIDCGAGDFVGCGGLNPFLRIHTPSVANVRLRAGVETGRDMAHLQSRSAIQHLRP